MKKKQFISVLLMALLIIVGCENGVVKKTMEKAKIAMKEKAYEKALLSLELALEENPSHEEAKTLHSIVDTYLQATQLIEEEKFAEAKKVIDQLDKGYADYTIKEDMDVLKEKIETHLTEIDKVAQVLTEAEEMFNQQQYEECKATLITHVIGSLSEHVNANPYATSEQKAKAEELVAKSQQALDEQEAQRMAEEERLAEEKRQEEERKKQQEPKVYSREEVTELLISLDKGMAVDEDPDDDFFKDAYINGERCYISNIVYPFGNDYHTRMFYVGSQTLKVYNLDYQAKGTIYEDQDFEWGGF